MAISEAVGFLRSIVGRRLGEEGEDAFGWDKHAFTRESEVIAAEFLLVFVVLLTGTLILQYLVEKVWHLHYLPASGATMILGMTIGGLVRLGGGHPDTDDGTSYLDFSSTVFFLGFLPPIIYNSGYIMKRRLFFANMGGILSLAFLGTAFSTFVVGFGLWGFGQMGMSYNISLIECICFGALISATDPVSTLAVFTELRVDPSLFYLVFGESVMNDAVAITLFRTTSKFVGLNITNEDAFIAFVDFNVSFIASTIIGYMLGLMSAYLYKNLNFREHRVSLVATFVGMVYIPFFLCETLQLSGIVAILFSALTARRYTNKNISPEAKRAAAFVFELLAYMSETAVFLYLGLAVFAKGSKGTYKVNFIAWTIFLMIGARMAHVYPLLTMVNCYRDYRAKLKGRHATFITTNTKHMVFFSGLRGAVAYACANIFPDEHGNKGVIISTTIVIVLITIFVNGGLTQKMLELLSIDTGVDPGPYVDKLKKHAKPYGFLKFEEKYVYPLVVRGYSQNTAKEMDLSSVAGDEEHLGASVNGRMAIVDREQDTHLGEEVADTSIPTFEEDEEAMGDGIQLSKGFANSSGPQAGKSSSMLYQESDSLW